MCPHATEILNVNRQILNFVFEKRNKKRKRMKSIPISPYVCTSDRLLTQNVQSARPKQMVAVRANTCEMTIVMNGNN